MNHPPSTAPLLEVRDLTVHFPLTRQHWLATKASKVHAVDGVSFNVPHGTTFGIVGESGSGKTTTAMAVMRLQPSTAGQIKLDQEDITTLQGEALRRLRQRVQIIFQDPYSSLNPRTRAGQIVREPMELLGLYSAAERNQRVAELFAKVGLRPEQQALFPHQFSGGQRQRIGIARALATQPELIVCDEPVSALDVAIQAQILNLLRQLQDDFGLTYLFISHDLGVVQHICDGIAVMYLGQIVEQADRLSLFRSPLHPYTWALLSAVPRVDGHAVRGERIRLQGDPPNPIDPPPGCRFAGRCPFVEPRCRQESPLLREINPQHWVACHRVTEQGLAPHH